MTTHADQVTDPLYRNWVKGGLGLKYLTEGFESLVDDTLKSVQTGFLDDIRSNTQGLQEVKCTECTTANVLPCPTPGMCNLRKRGGICTYHDKTNKLKTSNPCPNLICDKIYVKISHQHRYSTPSWKNTNAQNWCTNHYEIGKCFLPKSGYEGKTSTSETDSIGILHMAINCLPVQNRLDAYINPPNDILSKLINVRNLIFHSASCNLTKEELDSYIVDMVTLLEDKKTLLDSPDAKTAVLKLKQLKNDDFVISTKDELEIRVRALRAIDETTEKALRKIKHKQKEAIDMIEHTQAKKRKLSDQNEDPSHSNNSQFDELRSSMQKIQSTNEEIKGSLEIHENKLKCVEKNLEFTEATLTNVQKDFSNFKEAMKSTNDEIEYLKRNQSFIEEDFYDDDDDVDNYSDDENEGDSNDNEELDNYDDNDEDSNQSNDPNDDNEELDDEDDHNDDSNESNDYNESDAVDYDDDNNGYDDSNDNSNDNTDEDYY